MTLPRLSSICLLALFATLADGATRNEQHVTSDVDEPTWVPSADGPLVDWVDEAALDAPDGDFRAVARAVVDGEASKPMLRQFYRSYQLLYPFERPLPADWRLRAQAADGRRVGRASAAPTTWLSLGPSNVGGRTSAIAFDPFDANVAWVGAADGGVWRFSYNAGNQLWEPRFDDQPSMSIGAIAVDPFVPQLIYVGTGEMNYSLDEYNGVGIIRSTDGGNSWLPPVSVGGAGRIGRIALEAGTPNAYAATTSGLFKSTDGGDTWTLIHGGSNSNNVNVRGHVTDVRIKPGSPQTIIAGVRGGNGDPSGVWRSTDGGASFTQLGGSGACTLPTLAAGRRVSLALSESQPDTMLAALAEVNGQVWKSTDGGDTWCELPIAGFCGGQCWYDMVVGIHPADPNRMIAGGVGIYASADGGATWWDPPDTFPRGIGGIHVDHHAIEFHPLQGDTALNGNDGGLYHFDFSGAGRLPSVDNVEGGYVTAQYYGMGHDPVDPDIIYGGTQDNGTHRFTSGSTTIDRVDLIACGDGARIRVHPTMNHRIFHTVCPIGGVRFLVSDDQGQNSREISSGIDGSEGGNWAPPIELTDASTMYTATSDCVYKASNPAAGDPSTITWSKVVPACARGDMATDLTPSGGSVTTLSASPADSNVIWAGTNRGHVWVTTDGGASGFTEVWLSNGGANRYIGQVLVSRTDPMTAWITLGGYGGFSNGGHVFETTDGGGNWVDLSSNVPDVPMDAVLQDPNDPDRFWVGTWLGLYESCDHGGSWTKQPDVPNTAVIELTYDDQTRTVYAATHGRGVYKSDVSAGCAAGTPPRPVPDGVIDLGTPMYATKGTAGSVRVTWDVTSCADDVDYHLYVADLADKATYTYSSGSCNLGLSGDVEIPTPAGDVYWLMAGESAAGEESGHRRVSPGVWSSAKGGGLCPTSASQDLSLGCP